jgi:hypothetical protein
VVLETGEVHFFEDIYGEDAVLEKELARSLPVANPAHVHMNEVGRGVIAYAAAP